MIIQVQNYGLYCNQARIRSEGFSTLPSNFFLISIKYNWVIEIM